MRLRSNRLIVVYVHACGRIITIPHQHTRNKRTHVDTHAHKTYADAHAAHSDRFDSNPPKLTYSCNADSAKQQRGRGNYCQNTNMHSAYRRVDARLYTRAEQVHAHSNACALKRNVRFQVWVDLACSDADVIICLGFSERLGFVICRARCFGHSHSFSCS